MVDGLVLELVSWRSDAWFGHRPLLKLSFGRRLFGCKPDGQIASVDHFPEMVMYRGSQTRVKCPWWMGWCSSLLAVETRRGPGIAFGCKPEGQIFDLAGRPIRGIGLQTVIPRGSQTRVKYPWWMGWCSSSLAGEVMRGSGIAPLLKLSFGRRLFGCRPDGQIFDLAGRPIRGIGLQTVYRRFPESLPHLSKMRSLSTMGVLAGSVTSQFREFRS